MKNKECGKRKFSRFQAMLIISTNDFIGKKRKGHTKRREKRYYWCPSCRAYHLTSREENIKIEQ